jgi:UDP-glucuronate 4-epimerase
LGPFRVFNIGGDRPSDLNRVIELIEAALGRSAIRVPMALPPGDVVATSSDAASFSEAYGRVAATPLEVGIPRFVEWYRQYHGLV